MRKFLGISKVLGLVVGIMAVMTMTGCIRHHVMDASNFIDMAQIKSSKSPDAVKVYVGKLDFKGGSVYITKEGELSPWLKKGVVDAIKDISFVDSPRIADIAIIPVEYGYAHAIITSTLLLELNGKQVKLIAEHENLLRFIDDKSFNNHMLGLSDLLKRILEKSVIGNHIDLAKVPSEIRGIIRTKGGNFSHMERIRVKQ